MRGLVEKRQQLVDEVGEIGDGFDDFVGPADGADPVESGVDVGDQEAGVGEARLRMFRFAGRNAGTVGHEGSLSEGVVPVSAGGESSEASTSSGP